MTTYQRSSVETFELENPLYAGATVTLWTIDAAGAKTATKATLYDGVTGTGTLLNPQRLGSRGRWLQPIYVDVPVIATISNLLSIADHDTGILAGSQSLEAVADAEAAANSSRFTLGFIRRLVNTARSILVQIQAAVGSGNLAFVDAANVFTTEFQYMRWSDDTAGPGPYLVVDRVRSAPAGVEDIGGVLFNARTTTGAAETFAGIFAVSQDPTNGSIDGAIYLSPKIGNSYVDQIAAGAGVIFGNPTGGFPGTGIANAEVGYMVGGVNLTASIGAYDVPAVSGYTSAWAAQNLAVQTILETVAGHAFVWTGETGYLETVAAGSAVILDVLKNGVTIYTVNPQFAAGATALTAGTLVALANRTFAVGDRITISITQVGSGTAGARMRFTGKGALSY